MKYWHLVLLSPLLMAPSKCNNPSLGDAGTTGGARSTGGALATGGKLGTGGAIGMGGLARGGSGPPSGTSGGTHGTGGSSSQAGGGPTGGTTATDDCQRAGDTLSRLKCPQQKTPQGTPFATACRRARAEHLDWHPDCIAKITNCSQVATAYRGCP